ncbi:MAG: glycosyltransferase [Rhodothermaceae bacterium]|nr:glycosyltransferase [Rhodothermaceae bacterium]
MEFPLNLPALPSAPLISILMTSYNYETFIESAILSGLNQSYTNLELIICDDGSTDKSRGIAKRFAAEDERVKLIEQENSGVSAALNAAYDASTGELVCLLDADDLFHLQKIAEVVDHSQANPQAGFIIHSMRVVNDTGDTLYTLPRSGRFEEGWLADDVIRRGGRWRSMPASALCFRREVADLLFPLPGDSLPSMADAYLYMLAPLLTEVAFIDKPLADYRLHGSNMTGSLAFGEVHAEKFIVGMERVHESIEAKACPKLFEEMPLKLTNHLTYQEQSYFKSLFGTTSRSELLVQYARLLRLINQDDLYGTSRKLMGLVANGVAIGLPTSWRANWITWVMEAKWRKWVGK